ncbi:MAG TPA: hypothetical protein V6C57_27085 [Coleofasciculaceae cyanobacterium]
MDRHYPQLHICWQDLLLTLTRDRNYPAYRDLAPAWIKGVQNGQAENSAGCRYDFMNAIDASGSRPAAM